MAADPLDFSPSLLRLQEAPPPPMGRMVLWTLLTLLLALLVWALLGRLDIVAVADGKLVPRSYVKIVQPPEAGIVKEILVKEGEVVRAGQVLMRMDAVVNEADANSLEAELSRKRLALRRIEAEFSGKPFSMAQSSAAVVREVEAQYQANRASLEAALAEERSRLLKAKHELSAAEQVKNKIVETLPHYREQEKAYNDLYREGHVAALAVSDKRRERIEKEQELRIQEQVIESARASMQQSEKKLAQIASDYRRQLALERNDIRGQAEKLSQEVIKQTHRKSLLELKASQDGTVKDLATHTTGTVVQPGTVLLTLVPQKDTLAAEVWVSNSDIGFVRKGQRVKLKFAAFPFQKHGMMEGTVETVSADAADDAAMGDSPSAARSGRPLLYRALVALESMQLEANGMRYPLAAGMQTNAEIRLGDRTVMEYLLSPVRKAWHEAGRER